MCESHRWIGWISLDAADADAGGDSDLDIAFVSPGCAPGVLDEVILNTGCVSAVANCKNTVVQGGSTSTGGDDTSTVVLKDSCIGFNSDRDWAFGKGSFELGWVVDGDICVGLGTDDSLGDNIAAGSNFAST